MTNRMPELLWCDVWKSRFLMLGTHAVKLMLQGQHCKLFSSVPETIMQTSETGSDTGSTVTLQTSVASQAAVPTQVVQQVPVQQQVRTCCFWSAAAP